MFYITISNGLLEGDHRRRMGTAVWEFMWCIDKVTSIDEGGIGKVLGGRPVKLREIADGLGIDEETVSRHLIILEKEGYIQKTIAPYGIVIRVVKAKKRFGRKVEPHQENVEPRRDFVEPNKTVSIDKTTDTPPAAEESEIEVIAEEDLVPTRDLQRMKKPPRKMYKPIFAIFPNVKEHWYLNKEIIDAADRLFRDKGIETCKRAYAFYEEYKDEKFCPQIWTPIDMEEKWESLKYKHDKV